MDSKNLKVCCISDTHCQHDLLNVGSGDILIHAGDFTYTGKYEEIKSFAEWFGK